MIKERISQIHVLKLQANIKPKKQNGRKGDDPLAASTWNPDSPELVTPAASPQLPKIEGAIGLDNLATKNA